MGINDYPDIIYLFHKSVSAYNILYRRHAIDNDMVYYRLIHEEELKYEDENVEYGDYMLSKPNKVFRFLGIYRDDYDNCGEDGKDEFELGDFDNHCISNDCLFSKYQNL